MKKKKPKKSPAKSPSKSPPASSSKSAPPKSLPLESNPIELEDLDRPTLPSAAVSDAQIGCFAVPVAQQLQDSSDLASVQSDIPTCVKVIAVEQADPSPARDEINSPTLELSVVDQTLRSSVEVSDDATVSIDKRSSDVNVQAATTDAKVVTLSSLAADVYPSPSTGADVGRKELCFRA